MAFGANSNDARLRDAWRAFCDQIKEAGDHVFKDASGTTDGERTNSFRYLTQNLSQAFDIWLENRNTRYPTIHEFCGPTRKLGCDNADCIYHQSWINDRDTYKISGNLGTARMFNIAIQGPWRGTLHEPFGDLPVTNLFRKDIACNWRGDFELWISPDPKPGNWIQSTPGIRKIFYRQYFDHWDEVPATYRIERIGESDEPPPAITPDELIGSFESAGAFVVDVTKDWPDTLWEREETGAIFNQLVRYGGAKIPNASQNDSRRGRIIGVMNWDIAADEALVMEFNADPEWFWQITAVTVFGGSLEYRYRQVNLTSGMAPIDADGVTRIVLANDDPGFANWIDIQGHSRGQLYFRNMFTLLTPDFTTRIVKAADVGRELDGIATPITPEARREEMSRRRQAYLRRYPS
jgi:hypothetical protein